MANELSSGEHTRSALKLCLLSLAGYGLVYGLGVFLARALDVESFGDYNVAVAALTLLAAFTTLGLEKYGLKCLPRYYEKGDWERARGFGRFSSWTVLLLSALVAVVYGLWHSLAAIEGGVDPHVPTLMAVLFLPAVALFLLSIEVVTVNGGVAKATAVYRLWIPMGALLSIVALDRVAGKLSAPAAMLCYGGAWLFGLALIHRLKRRTTPPEVSAAAASYEPRLWLKGGFLFLVHSLLLTLFATSGLLVLELVHSSEQIVGTFAACMQVAGLILIVATSTNRFYAPRISRMIEHRDQRGMLQLIRSRYAWLVPLTAVYLGAVLLAGPAILRLYGAEYAGAHGALAVIALGAAVSVLFAMAPYYLKFIDEGSIVLTVTGTAAVVYVALLVFLGRRHGALGAAYAYAISAAGMSIVLAIVAALKFRRRREGWPEGLDPAGRS